MSADTNEYVVMLAKARAQRAALDVVIAGLEQLLGTAGEDDSQPLSVLTKVDTELRADSFFGLSIPDAIRKYLAIAKAPQSLSDITNALQKGGLITTSKNLLSTVSATLVRMKRLDGDVVPVQGKWGLTEWYKGLRQEKIAASAKPKKKKKVKAKAKPAQPKEEAQSSPSTGSPKPTDEQIARIKELADSGKKAGEIAKETGVHVFNVTRLMKAHASKLAPEASGQAQA
jgi:hypothetical protein